MLFVDDDHPQVVYVSAEDVAADVIQEGLGIFTKTADLKVNNKPIWKHITRDMFLFYSGIKHCILSIIIIFYRANKMFITF